MHAFRRMYSHLQHPPPEVTLPETPNGRRLRVADTSRETVFVPVRQVDAFASLRAEPGGGWVAIG